MTDSVTTEGLVASGITKIFGGNEALTDVTLDVRPGEVLCLVGENGAGKSTLGKVFAGFHAPTAGEVSLAGQPLEGLTPRKALEFGIAMVSQEADVVTSMTVAENVFLGSEPSRASVVNRKGMREETRKLAETLGVDIDPDQITGDLSPAGKQMVQILRALRTDAKYLVLDEPTSSLGASEKARLLSLVRQLAERGVGIVYVSHFLEEVFDIGDRAAVLKDGHLVAVNDVATLTAADLVKQMVGRDADSFYNRDGESDPGDVELQIVNFSGDGVADVNLELRSGEILGIGGLVGSGRTELAELIFGARKRDSGTLLLHGKDITPSSPAHALENGICMLTEDRAYSGLLKGASVSDNIALARSERLGFLLRGEKSLARRMVDRLHVAPRRTGVDVASLSGGNQQKVLLGRWLAVEGGHVFILDEPTKGVDIGAKHEIYRLIHELAREGHVVLLISSDLPELLSLSDRIAVMRDGQVVNVVEASDASEESLMKEFVDVDV